MLDCRRARHRILASASGCLARDAAAGEERLMEALSEVLREVKLNGAAFLDAEFREPWCVVARGRLPRLFKVNLRASPSGEWLERSFRHSVAEAGSPRAGADVILARLSEVLFVEALRCYVESLPAEQRGWLAGLRDPCVGKGLKLLHGDAARAWTVDELAREVGCSRSILAARFTHYVGQPPIQYLTKWRLALAASQLRSSGTRLA